jgi:uncharacterized protein (DUF2147 family)
MFVSVLALSLAAASPATLSGDWYTDDRSALVRIGSCGRTLCGRIVRVLARGAPPNDVNNPDPAARRRSLVGLAVLSGFTPSGPRAASGGRAYDPKTGRSYRASLQLNPNGTLKVTGCVLFVCRSRTWTRG